MIITRRDFIGFDTSHFSLQMMKSFRRTYFLFIL
ncbi:unnamed protein product [Arabidopsis halleri]